MVSRCHIRELPVMRALKEVTREKDELLNRSWSRRYFTRTLRHVWGQPLDNVDLLPRSSVGQLLPGERLHVPILLQPGHTSFGRIYLPPKVRGFLLHRVKRLLTSPIVMVGTPINQQSRQHHQENGTHSEWTASAFLPGMVRPGMVRPGMARPGMARP